MCRPPTGRSGTRVDKKQENRNKKANNRKHSAGSRILAQLFEVFDGSSYQRYPGALVSPFSPIPATNTEMKAEQGFYERFTQRALYVSSVYLKVYQDNTASLAQGHPRPHACPVNTASLVTPHPGLALYTSLMS